MLLGLMVVCVLHASLAFYRVFMLAVEMRAQVVSGCILFGIIVSSATLPLFPSLKVKGWHTHDFNKRGEFPNTVLGGCAVIIKLLVSFCSTKHGTGNTNPSPGVSLALICFVWSHYTTYVFIFAIMNTSDISCLL